ncbi:MAG: sugar phosphate nucleotidyltransferase [Candidatus Binatia bacterium]|nr:sugar phosphate nucleotidyltransferase [Candidatus Binatia bacterium]
MARAPLYGVIMAGGQGTRFWPLSRAREPKQFLRLDGKASLLQRTAERLAPLVGWERLLVVTHRSYARRVREELPQLAEGNLLLEPEGKNTLPCLLLAAVAIRRRDADAVMIAVPADHVVKPAARWRQTLRRAALLAGQQALVTVGIRPSRVETGYGYIECGAQLAVPGREGTAYSVRQFREKPDSRTARRFLRNGRFLWNSGVFVWHLNTFLQAASTTAPEVVACFVDMLTSGQPISPRRIASAYAKLPSLSVDHGVLEPVSKRGSPPIVVVEGSFSWSDVGSWTELGVFFSTDEHGNVSHGRVLNWNASDNIVWSPSRLVALAAVHGLIVVDTPDALLVCPKDDAQAVRQVVAELKLRGYGKWA